MRMNMLFLVILDGSAGNSGFEVYEKADMALHEAKSTKAPILRFSGSCLSAFAVTRNFLTA